MILDTMEAELKEATILRNFYEGLIGYCMTHIDDFDNVIQAYTKLQKEEKKEHE